MDSASSCSQAMHMQFSSRERDPPVTTDAKITALVAELRSQGLPPKAIARRLGLRPAEVSALVQQHAAQLASSADPAILPPLKACYLSPGWSTGLGFLGEAAQWRAYDPDVGGSEGMASALWARAHRFDKLAVCGCLVDTYCLGVKNAFGPKIMTGEEFRSFFRRYFSSYDAPPIEVAMELLQSLVLGAVEYADSLGLSPHPDFAAVRPTLGAWNGPSPIRFGKDGQPFYIQGPDDDVYRIMQTLRRHLGDGGFGATIEAG
jgi:hypothetical protein